MRKQLLIFFVLTFILFLTSGCLNKKADSSETNIGQTSDNSTTAPTTGQLRALADYWLSFDEAHKNLSSSTYSLPSIDALPTGDSLRFSLLSNSPSFLMYDPLNGSNLGWFSYFSGYAPGVLGQSAVFSVDGNQFIGYLSGPQIPSAGTVQFYIYWTGYINAYPNPLNWIVSQAGFGGATVGDIQLMLFKNGTLVFSQWSGDDWAYQFSTMALPLKQWTKITMAYGPPNGLHLWLNDERVVRETNRQFPLSSRPFYLGYFSDAFRGKLDEVVTYSGTPLKIISPANGVVFLPTDEITFSGFGLNLSWSRNGIPMGSGNIVKATLPGGTHNITLTGQNAVGQPSSDNITITVQEEISKIKIKNLDVDPDHAFDNNFSVSYRAAKTHFQAIGCSADDTELGAVSADWEIQGEGGKVNTPLRAGILSELGVPGEPPLPMRIGNIDGQESVSNKETVTFNSYLSSTLSGPIKLVAKRGNLPPVSVSISIKQPTVSINVKYVAGFSPSLLSNIPIWVQTAKKVWGQGENLIDIQEFSQPSEVDNHEFVPFPKDANGEYPSGEYLFREVKPLPLVPSLLNPLITDEVADRYYHVVSPGFVVPRQSEELLKKRVSNTDVVNFFVSNTFFSVKYKIENSIEKAKLEKLEAGGVTFDSVDAYKMAFGPVKINDKNDGGTIITDPPFLISSLSEGDYRDAAEVVLAHELGHMLLHQGEDLDHNMYDQAKNVMGTEFQFPGKRLVAKQFIIVFDYEHTRDPDSFFIVEK